MQDWHTPQKQSAVGIIMFAGKSLREMVAVLLIFIGTLLRKEQSSNMMIIGSILIFLYILIKAVLEYFYFTFYIEEGKFIIRQGVFAKKNISIPIERIQTVQLEQSLLHKVINQYKVLIDTAGSEKTEVSIQALALGKALELKQLLTDHSAAAQVATGEVENKIQLGFSDILKLALSANHLETFGILAAFVLARLEDVRELFNIDTYEWMTEHGEELDMTAQAIAVIIFMVLSISIIISILRVILKYNNFTILLSVKGFHLAHGLLQSKQQFIGSRKIQFLQWNANWLRRRLGIFMLHLKTVGEGDIKRKQKITVPITKQDHLHTLTTYYQPLLPSASPVTNSIQPQYIYRNILLRGLPVSLVLTGIAFIWLQWNGLWLMLWLIYFIITTYIFWKNFRFWMNDQALEISRGVWGRERVVLNWNKVQFVTLQQSIYERRKHLATLVLHTASGAITIPFLKLEEAKAILDLSTMKIEISKERWM